MTVLLFDVCGFTSMSERLDPEDVREIMERAFDVILETVHAYGGTVNQFLGDGVMALFHDIEGADDQAVRAVSAASAIQNDLAAVRAAVERGHGVEFRVRAGVHTGPVTVGVIGRGLRNDYVSHCETTNITARLVNLARGGDVLVSAYTRELTKGAFLFLPLDDLCPNAEAPPLPTWTLARDSLERVDAEAGFLVAM